MFEHDQKIINILLAQDIQFKRLYDKHEILNKRVDSANHKQEDLDDSSLEQLKKEKLALVDQMAKIIDQHKGTSKNSVTRP
ncbi:MAG: YdcH family protein [Candidatus Eutrophobiaceae bacterium]